MTYATYREAMVAGHDALKRNERARAQAAFEAALPLAEDGIETAEALHFVAWMLMQQGRHADARERLAKLLELPHIGDRERAGAYHLTAHALINDGKGAEAGEWFAKIVALKDPGAVLLCEAHVALGYELSAKGRYDDARQAFAASMAVDGGQPVTKASAAFHTAKAWFEEKQYAEAKAQLEAFASTGGAFPNEMKEAETLLERIELRLKT
jgi:tetratricopeptide (TPR) repeat protein